MAAFVADGWRLASEVGLCALLLFPSRGALGGNDSVREYSRTL